MNVLPLNKFVPQFAVLLLAACASACQATQQREPINPELYDYLVQDVCLDDEGGVTGADPATCEKRRNVVIGEPIPYLLTDWDTQGKRAFQAVSSFPVRAEDGHTRIMVSKNFGADLGADFEFEFNPLRGDGYDLLDINFSGFVSFIRTFDGSCGDQLWAPSLGLRDIERPGVRSGGWILFPLKEPPGSWAPITTVVNKTAKIQLGQPLANSQCASGSSLARTFWHAPADYNFESGKTLRAIKSLHFAATDVGAENNALELYYFTKEYGFTRWEAWIPRRRCYDIAANTPPGQLRPNCEPDRSPPKADLALGAGDPKLNLRARCSRLIVSATGHPDVDRWGGQDWVRIDCRDNSRHSPLRKPQLMLANEMAQINGVDDVDF